MLKVYRAILILLSPVLNLYMARRKRRGKEDLQRFPERLGHAGIKRPPGSLVWFHAVSVGESLSTLPLIERLLETHPNLHILLTTGTRTSAKLMANRLPERAIHQFIPIDKLSAVKRFLDHWKPNLVLWFESELWPNLITEVHVNKIPMVMVNARLSESAHKKWTLLRLLVSPLLEKVKLCLPQTKQDGERLRDLGVKEIGTIGNLKYAAQCLPNDEEILWALSRSFKSRAIWLASSTHAGEEEFVIEAHEKLKKKHPNILTIITPRSPDRGNEIKAMARKRGLSASLRSRDETVDKNTDFYIADTLGELGIFYRLCPIVFVGGSLVPIGGHNILEAGQLGCAVIHGPHMENFLDISAAFSASLASIKVKSASDMAHHVSHLLEHEMEVRRMGLAASQVVHVQQSILEDVVRDISPYLPT